MRLGVFICCAPDDNAVALALSRALERRSISTWIAFRDVPPGAESTKAPLWRRLRRSNAVVFVVSSKTANSLQAAREFQFASESGLPVIAFRVEDASGGDLITKLGSQQRFDAFPPPAEDHLDAFVTQLSDLIRNAEADGSPLAGGNAPPAFGRQRRRVGACPPSRTEANQRTHTDRDIQRRVDEPALREEPPTAVRRLDEATMARFADRNATLRRSPAAPAEAGWRQGRCARRRLYELRAEHEPRFEPRSRRRPKKSSAERARGAGAAQQSLDSPSICHRNIGRRSSRSRRRHRPVAAA